MKSILQSDKSVCYVCGRYGANNEHHIYNGYNRKKSEKDGMKVYLHATCHDYIHTNEFADLMLKAKCQVKWQEYYNKTKEDFIKRYGKSYIDRLIEWRKQNDKKDTNK